MKTAAEEKHCRVVNITPNKHLECQIGLWNVETEASTLSITDTDHIVNQLGREILGITS
jgi:hypothetical protein